MVLIDKTKCIACGDCVADCLSNNLILEDGEVQYRSHCITCGHCVAVCPTGAVSIPEYDMEDIIDVEDSISISYDKLMQTLKTRRSIRNYKDKAVEKQVIENIVQAGRYTATAANRQACQFIFVQEKLEDLKRFIWEDLEQAVKEKQEAAKPIEHLVQLKHRTGIDYLFRNTPAVLYVSAENLWDAGMATQNMEHAAISQGLGMMYNGYLLRATRISKRAQELLQLEENQPLATCMLVGYPAVKYERSAPRRKGNYLFL